MYTRNLLRANNVINDGGRFTLDSTNPDKAAVRYTNLPNQLIAILVHNNNGNNGRFRIAYDGYQPISRKLPSVDGGGAGFGYIYLIDPSKANSYDISIGVPVGTGNAPISLDVQLVSLMFPLNTSGVQNQEIPLNGADCAFNGYSRSYCTPQPTWYNATVMSEGGLGLMGIMINGQNSVEIYGTNISYDYQDYYKSYIEKGIGAENIALNYHMESGRTVSHEFFGMAEQLVFAPVSMEDSTHLGCISVQQTG